MSFLYFFAGITRDHFQVTGLDQRQIAANEHFVCSDCHRTMLLTPSGKCGVCGSEAVYPFAVLDGGRQ
jgi:hypothetical protein